MPIEITIALFTLFGVTLGYVVSWKQNERTIETSFSNIEDSFNFKIIENIEQIENDISVLKKGSSIDKMKEALDIYVGIIVNHKKYTKKDNAAKNKKSSKESELNKASEKAIGNIISYGSKETMEVLAKYQQFLYLTNDPAPETVICFVSVLVAQIKYDTVKEIINPMTILKIKFSAYNTLENDIISEFKKIHKDYELPDMFFTDIPA